MSDQEQRQEQTGQLYKSGRWTKPDLHNCGSAAPTLKTHRSIKWDEETIAEHDRERGTRQKIDEPPTPYSYIDINEPDSANTGELIDNTSAAGTVSGQGETGETVCCVFNLNSHSSEAEKLKQIAQEQQSVRNRLLPESCKTTYGELEQPPASSQQQERHSGAGDMNSRSFLPSNANVAENWTQLSAQLEYEAMKSQQERLVRHENSNGDNEKDGGVDANLNTEKEKVKEPGNGPEPEQHYTYAFASALADKQTANLKKFVHASGKQMREGLGSSSFGEEEEEREPGVNDGSGGAAFEQHRSKHYNEFKVVQAMKAKMATKARRKQERMSLGLSTGDTDSSEGDEDEEDGI